MLPIDFFWRAVQRHGERTALVGPRRSLTFAELGREVQALAGLLQDLDPPSPSAPGNRVGLGALNSEDHVLALLAILAAGKVWVPLNPRSSVADNATLLGAFDAEARAGIGHATDHARRNAVRGGHVEHRFGIRRADHRTSLRFTEEQRPQRQCVPCGQVDGDAERVLAVADRRFREGHGQAPFAAIVGGAEESSVRECAERIDQGALAAEIAGQIGRAHV